MSTIETKDCGIRQETCNRMENYGMTEEAEYQQFIFSKKHRTDHHYKGNEILITKTHNSAAHNKENLR